MPTLAGWLTGQQVPQETIAHTLSLMSDVLARHGGEKLQTISPGAGLVSFAEPAHTAEYELAVLDWAVERRTLTYHRPLSGLHPLYYIADWPEQGNLLFASEIKALFAAGVPRKWHLAALDQLLHQGFIPAPWTAFQRIQVVPAGATLRWQHAHLLLNQVDTYDLETPDSTQEPIANLAEWLQRAVEQQLPSHDQLAALTAGDIPSLLPIILASQASTRPFTVAMVSQRKSSRAKVWRNAETVATTYDKTFLAITALADPEYWVPTLVETETPALHMRPCIIHQLLHTLSAETGARVALTGLGAHALLDPASGQAASNFSSAADEQHTLLYRYQSSVHARGEGSPSPWSRDVQQALSQQEPWSETLHARRLQRRAGQFSNTRQAWHYLDLQLRLPDLLVHPFHQIAAQEGIALRSPYLHPDTITLLPRLATHINTPEQRNTLWPALLQQHYPHPLHPFEEAPLNLSALPIPLDSPLVQQLFSDEQIKATGLFDLQFVHSLRNSEQNESMKDFFLFILTTQALAQLFTLSL